MAVVVALTLPTSPRGRIIRQKAIANSQEVENAADEHRETDFAYSKNQSRRQYSVARRLRDKISGAPINDRLPPNAAAKPAASVDETRSRFAAADHRGIKTAATGVVREDARHQTHHHHNR